MTVADVARRRLLQALALAPLLGLAAACQLPGGGPPPRAFRLTPKSSFADDLPEVDWSLAVDRPNSATAIDSNRIARLSGVKVEYYGNAAWVDRPAAMIEPLIIQSFRNSGAIEVVVDRRSEVRPDFLLQTTIAAFHAEPREAGPPAASVALSASLLALPRRKVVGTTEIGRTEVARADDLEAIAAALDEALGGALRRLVEWTLVTGEAAVARS